MGGSGRSVGRLLCCVIITKLLIYNNICYPLDCCCRVGSDRRGRWWWGCCSFRTELSVGDGRWRGSQQEEAKTRTGVKDIHSFPPFLLLITVQCVVVVCWWVGRVIGNNIIFIVQISLQHRRRRTRKGRRWREINCEFIFMPKSREYNIMYRTNVAGT